MSTLNKNLRVYAYFLGQLAQNLWAIKVWSAKRINFMNKWHLFLTLPTLMNFKLVDLGQSYVPQKNSLTPTVRKKKLTLKEF